MPEINFSLDIAHRVTSLCSDGFNPAYFIATPSVIE